MMIKAAMRDGSYPSWPVMVVFSVLLHGAVAVGIWTAQRYAFPRVQAPTILSVHLVAPSPGVFPAPAKAPAAQRAASSEPKAKAVRPVPRGERKAVSIRPPEVQVSVPKPVPTPPSAAQPSSKAPSASAAQEAPQSPAVSAAPPEGGGGRLRAEEARYLLMLQARIEESWRAYVPDEQGILGEVQILIAPDGRIRDFKFQRGSGRTSVDESIVRALKKVALPPPPPSLADQPLLIRFWPSGSPS